ncbi:MAG TPA: hypothetical protein VE398_00725 [Acidobacteriota bacterium]|nr:hypothetical protein [Acidobacteriota bacterium]
MLLRDVVAEGGRVWVKSEWGPASDDWPAVSFSKRTVGDYLRQEFRPGRDIIIYIGTGSPATTEKPEHRQRLLSAVSIEPHQILETRECIPAESWEQAQRQYRGRWFWSMPALAIWEIEGFPLAHDVTPATYRQLGVIVNRGNVVEVAPEEYDTILQLQVLPVAFEPPPKVAKFGKTRTLLNLSTEIRAEIGRMAAGIHGRVAASGTERTSVNPLRMMSDTDIHIMLGTKWQEQNGHCFLCQGPLLPGTKNYLLQCSPDRIDSQDAAYSEANTRITHLGCNLAKNKVNLADFEDWLLVVRGELSDLNHENLP